MLKLNLLIEEDESKKIRRQLRRAETDTNELLPKTVEELKVQMRFDLQLSKRRTKHIRQHLAKKDEREEKEHQNN